MKKNILSIMLVISICFTMFSNFTLAETIDKENNNVIYKVLPGTEEWQKIDNHDDMVAGCQIDEYSLAKMSTEELYNALVDYPLFNDVFLYPTLESGMVYIKDTFNGAKVFFDRKDAAEVVLEKYLSQDLETKIVSEMKEKSQVSPFLYSKIELIISQDEIMSKYDKTQKEALTEKTLENIKVKEKYNDVFNYSITSGLEIIGERVETKSLSYTTTYVYTPNNSAVLAYYDITPELTSAEKQDYLDYVENTYPNATVLRDATQKYNCHSYAWYSTSSSNKYWIDDPSEYWEDGSYDYTGYRPGANSGNKMFYRYGDHSAIMISYESHLRYSGVLCKSKWGPGPLMEHKANYCPYNYGYIDFYK